MVGLRFFSHTDWQPMGTEKRKDVRHPLNEEVFAALGRKYDKVGQVKDISLGGLGFEYIGSKDAEGAQDQVDIFCSGSDDSIYNIACRVIYDRVLHVPQIDPRYVDSLTIRRCGIEFVELEKDDVERLQEFFVRYGKQFVP